jgi:hypothetical protein
LAVELKLNVEIPVEPVEETLSEQPPPVEEKGKKKK